MIEPSCTETCASEDSTICGKTFLAISYIPAMNTAPVAMLSPVSIKTAQKQVVNHADCLFLTKNSPLLSKSTHEPKKTLNTRGAREVEG